MIDKLKTLLKNIFAVLIFSALTLLFFSNIKKEEVKASLVPSKTNYEKIVKNEPDNFDDYINLYDDYLKENPQNIEIANTEDVYQLYEEDLPDDIIIDEKVIQKSDKNIVIIPTKKPPYFENPMIAIVIDDMGISKKRTHDINSLIFPITSSFLTYGKDLEEQISDSLKAGHEIIAHIPMEAYTNKDVAPRILKTSMNEKQVETELNNMLSMFKDIKGINNHMGSKFTESSKHMNEVMKVLKEKNMFFLDSKTSHKSVGSVISKENDVKYANRHIFLDNKNELKYILSQLDEVEKIAKKRGYAIAIGHPKTQTYEALKIWLPTTKQKGFKLVHISEIVEKLN